MRKINVKFFSQESVNGNLSIYSIDIRKNRNKYETDYALLANLYELEKKYEVEFVDSYENVCIFYSNINAIENSDINLINISNKLKSGETKQVLFYQLDMNWSTGENSASEIENILLHYFGDNINKVKLTITGLNWKHNWNRIKPIYNLGFFTYVLNKNIFESKNYNLETTERNKWIYTTHNRVRPVRLYLYDYLIENNLLDKFEYSFFPVKKSEGVEFINWNDIIGSDEGMKTQRDFYPTKVFENENIKDGHKDVQLVNFEKSLNTYIDLIFETTYNVENIFPFSEKSFKGIISKKPFILFGGQDIYIGMEKLGFKNYNDLIDVQKYSEQSNAKDRMAVIFESINNICRMDIESLKNYFIQQRKKIEYNYNVLIELINKNDKQFLELFN